VCAILVVMDETSRGITGHDSLADITNDVQGHEDILPALEKKFTPEAMEAMSGLRGAWVMLGVGSKVSDSPAIGAVDSDEMVRRVRRSTLYGRAEDEERVGTEVWSQNRVRDAGKFRKQPSPDGPRILGIDHWGRAFVGPLTDDALNALTGVGYQESGDDDFGGDVLKPDEVLLRGAYADGTSDSGAYYGMQVPINPAQEASDAWLNAVNEWTFSQAA
jgi:hypothetical protein